MWRNLQPGLPRKVVRSYLFFCLLAVCALAAGVSLAMQAVICQRLESAHLACLNRAAATIEIEYLRNEHRNLSELLKRTKTEGNLAYGAIVGLDGRYLAHTSDEHVNKEVADREGTYYQINDVSRLHYTDEASRPVREYRYPLTVRKNYIGQLQLGAVMPHPWHTFLQTFELTSLTVLGSLIVIGLGAVVIARQSAPLAEVETQLSRLARLPVGAKLGLQTHTPRSAVAIGWNRLVSQLEERQKGNLQDLESRIARLVDRSERGGTTDILGVIPDGIAVTDSAGQITQANPACSGLLGVGVDPAQLVGQTVPQYFQHDAAMALEEFLTPDSELRPLVAEVDLTSDQQERILRVARYPWRDESGNLVGHVWMLRDITQQKLSEKMRNQFLDAASHELRTPLTSIKAYAELLSELDEADVESQKEFCNTINSEATRLSRFVDDLLSISSMEMGSLSVTRQNTDVQRMLEEVVEKVEPLVKQHAQTLEVTVPAKLPQLQIDKDKIMVTLVNLLGNAVKYTPEKGKIGLKVKADPQQLAIEIVDTGYGIAPDELPKVFEKFFRSSDSRVLNKTGTGLGLSLAREVVRLHGGDITAVSELNKGSAFTVTLPIPAR